MKPPTERFSTRVENYVKYRPSYPQGVIELLSRTCGLGPASTVADIGAGTGILAKLLLDTGATVYAVEPNAEMRQVSEQLLASHPNFHSVDATAESTTLPDGSIDLITAGQAYHWFNRELAHPEFQRILKPHGWAALIWNTRLQAGTPFLTEYDALLRRYAPEYSEVTHTRVDDSEFDTLFGRGNWQVTHFDNRQLFDLEGLLGRAFSSSYTPEADQSGHDKLKAALIDLFRRHQHGDRVAFEYDTKVFYGQPRL